MLSDRGNTFRQSYALEIFTAGKKILLYFRDTFSGMPKSSVMVEVDVEEHSKTIIVTAKVKNAHYVYTKEYAS